MKDCKEPRQESWATKTMSLVDAQLRRRVIRNSKSVETKNHIVPTIFVLISLDPQESRQ